MAQSKQAAPSVIYQIKITLKDTKPPVWRRVELSGDMTLTKLHKVIQAVMGWQDYHLHSFTVGAVEYGVFEPELRLRSERGVKLGQIIPGEKFKFRYQYDFGDSWEHDLVVEKVLAPEPGVSYPRILTGRRACPPEDVGGVWGYESFLQAIQDPKHPEHDEYLEWIGGDFDPEAFDLADVAQALARIR
jgi:hypothetical protein